MKRGRGFVGFALLLLIVLCGSSCGKHAPEIREVAVGETLVDTYGAVEGQLEYQINRIQYSTNVKDLGVDPGELQCQEVYYEDQGEGVSIEWPEYVDQETGVLADHLLFVLIDVSVKNENAVSKISTEGENQDDSYYTFGLNRLSICDIGEQGQNGFLNYDVIWNSGVEAFDAASLGTNGSNYFILHQGESMSYQVGFIVGSNDGEFSTLYATNGGGSYYAEDASFVHLGISSIG